MELFLIYLWLKLDSIVILITLLAIVFAIVTAISLAAWADSRGNLNSPTLYNKDREKEKITFWWKVVRITGMTTLLCSLFSVFIPSSKDMAILVASSVAIDVVKSPEGQKIGTLIRAKANELLDDELRKLQPQPPVKKD